VRRGVALLGEFPCPALLPDGTSVRDVEAAKRWLVAYLARYETTKNGSRKLKPRNNAQQLAPSAE
jgi:hypothetical protein